VDTGGGGSGGSDRGNEGTDCERFVNWLMGVIEPRIPRWFSQIRIGRAFALNLTTFNNYPTTGFRDNLVNNGQGSGVYRHVLGGAASVLLEIGLAKLYQDYSDSAQRDNPRNSDQRRAEAQTELNGTQAGAELGDLVKRRDRGDLTASELRVEIQKLLCEE